MEPSCTTDSVRSNKSPIFAMWMISFFFFHGDSTSVLSIHDSLTKFDETSGLRPNEAKSEAFIVEWDRELETLLTY